MNKQSFSHLSHELRNPLAAIQLFVELLLNDSMSSLTQEQKEMVINIQKSNDQMKKILEDVTTHSDQKDMS